MTIYQIKWLLDERQNCYIHRLFYTSQKWCYITSFGGHRIKLSEDMSDEYIHKQIDFVVKLDLNHNRSRHKFFPSYG